MTKLNHHFQKLTAPPLFSEIEKRIDKLAQAQANAKILDLGVGDVTAPLPSSVIQALTRGSLEMGDPKTLCELVAEHDYQNRITPDEIFIAGGVNADLGNLQEIFATDNRVAVPDPAYPIYVETNVMAGRTRPLLKTGRYGGITYLPCTESNQFQPEPPNSHVDLIYLSSPNNPTGIALTKPVLTAWVEYAKKNGSVILFDGTYEAFITSDAPRSIYEIEGAKEVAIEIRSFSKSAGFTGLCCSYTVVPHALKVQDAGAIHSLNALWKRRTETKTSGVSYPIQKAAAALYTPQGKKEVQAQIELYLNRAKLLRDGLKKIGYSIYGGVDSPYVWCKTPPKVDSWEFFDFLLENAHIVGIPGIGFGQAGDGFIRFSGFAEPIDEALERFKRLA